MNQLTVASISVSAALGGSEWSLLDFARRAESNGIRAIVLLPKDGPLAEALRKEGVAFGIAPAPEELLKLSQREMVSVGGLFTLTTGLTKWSRAIANEAKRLLGAPPAVLYSNGFKAHLATQLVRGPKHVWHLREFPPEKTAALWKPLAGTLPTVTIANSQAVADAWRVGGMKPRVVLNGVDLDRFKPAGPTYWIHDHLELPHDTQLIGMPAIFARWKGHLQVVEAFERAAEQLPDAHLVLVGGAIYDTGAERGFAEELVKRVGRASMGGSGQKKLNDRIHFVRHSAEPWKLYPEFDVVVHFSTRPEPFGRVVAEAMASGVPPIAAKAGGPTEIVEDGVSGWLVTPGDTAALCGMMIKAANIMRSGHGPAIRAASRARAESLFSAERYATEVSAVLRETTAAK